MRIRWLWWGMWNKPQPRNTSRGDKNNIHLGISLATLREWRSWRSGWSPCFYPGAYMWRSYRKMEGKYINKRLAPSSTAEYILPEWYWVTRNPIHHEFFFIHLQQKPKYRMFKGKMRRCIRMLIAVDMTRGVQVQAQSSRPPRTDPLRVAPKLASRFLLQIFFLVCPAIFWGGLAS